jgi:hypothetical protein
MLRNFGISLLFLALLAVGFEGYRERERVRTSAPVSGAPTEETGDVHAANDGTGFIPPSR